MENPDKFFVSRHSMRPNFRKGEKSAEEYFGISEKGVELAKERAKEIAEMIEKSEPSSVIFIGGASEEPRTKSTAEAYGDELAELYKEREDVVVLTKKEIDNLEKENDNQSKKIDDVKNVISNNPEKKIVVGYPLFLKNFSIRKSGAMISDREPSKFLDTLLKKHNFDEYELAKEWISNNGVLDGENKIASPEEIAKAYLDGINRLRSFAGKFSSGRPRVFGIVGHRPGIDFLITYLANNRRIDVESFEKVTGGSLSTETEIVNIDFADDKIAICYRGNKYELSEKNE